MCCNKTKKHLGILLALFITITITITSPASFALPIDWHGVIGMDTTFIESYRRITPTDKTDKKEDDEPGTGTQAVPLASGGQTSASFQSYILRLNPVMVINDSATFKAEISTGYGRGGILGDSSVQSLERGFGNALYNINHSYTEKGPYLGLGQFLLELYSDTATYILGRQSFHWGLGAVHNSGEEVWDRYAHVRDGITMKVRLGNFRISPFWARINSTDGLTRASRVREYGLNFLYDNPARDLSIGLLYSKKSHGADNTSITTKIKNPTEPEPLGHTDVKLTDLYFRKSFGLFEFALEFPLLSGRMGDSSYKTQAIILESTFRPEKSWAIGFDWGRVNGDDGGKKAFEAMYLHPNYKIAHLLFHYNLLAVADPDKGLYDAYITNAMYFKLHGTYSSDPWIFKTAFILAKALEVAQSGKETSFNHQRNTYFKAKADQEDDLGFEIDVDLDYRWNTEVTVGASVGHLFTGDYFAFSNDPNSVHESKNSFVLQLRTVVEF